MGPIARENCLICLRSKRIWCLYFAPLRQARSFGHPLSRICTLVMPETPRDLLMSGKAVDTRDLEMAPVL
mgnify:CR=1 FL=1|jgi:hypothetical protein